jgi:hypothetical protein
MFPVIGSVIDFLHALLMVGWIAGLPLLFSRRFPRVTRAYAVYAVVFVTVNLGSRWVLGECVLTTLARWFWEHGAVPPGSAPNEWFTVRLAMMVFHLTPSHAIIKRLSELLIMVTAVGMLFSGRRRGARGSALGRDDWRGVRPLGRSQDAEHEGG